MSDLASDEGSTASTDIIMVRTELSDVSIAFIMQTYTCTCNRNLKLTMMESWRRNLTLSGMKWTPSKMRWDCTEVFNVCYLNAEISKLT